MSLYTALTQVLAPYAAKINGLLTGWNGTVYSTPGEAVRQQIADLHVLIGDAPGRAISASAISYGDSDVETALDGVNGRLDEQGEDILELQNGGYIADQQQIGAKINAWLNDHPEATTTVEDGSLTNKKLVVGTLGFVTPEMYGAKGDGLTDDTQAWQSAVDSGYPVIANGKATYLCGQITVTKDFVLDGQGCKFIANGNVLFSCAGTLLGSAEEQTYAFNTAGYTVQDASYSAFTGMAVMKSETLLYTGADTYKQGAVVEFKGGRLTERLMLDITSPTIDFYEGIKVLIKNINGIIHRVDSTATRGIVVNHSDNCIIENVIAESNCYALIEVNECINTLIQNCDIKHVFGSEGSNSYPIVVSSSTHTNICNCNIYNRFWHCISTGGYDPAYVVYDTNVHNCTLKSEMIYGYLDHGNAVKTSVIDCISTGIFVNAPAIVRGCTIITLTDSFDRLLVVLNVAFDERISNYTVDGVKFLTGGYRKTVYAGVTMRGSASYAGVFKNVSLRNLKSEGLMETNSGITFTKGTAITTVKNVTIEDCDIPIHGIVSNFDLFDISAMKMFVSNCTANLFGGSTTNIGNNRFNIVYLTNCDFTALRGDIAELIMCNVKIAIANSSITTMVGSNIMGTIASAVILATTRLALSNYSISNLATRDYTRGNDGKYYSIGMVGGVLTATEYTG